MFQMGNCLNSDKHVISTTENKVIISVVGLDDSGKSTTVKVLKGDKDLNDVSPTVGYEPHEIKYYSKNIALYDLGGGARVRDIWKHYIAESYGFIYVIDASNRNRVHEAKNVFAAFVENEKVSGKPILILGNKQDQANSLDESEIVQYLNIEELVNKYQIPCRVETCFALSGIGKNIDESIRVGFEWLIKYISMHHEELKVRIDEDVQRQKSQESRLRREKSERVRSSRKDNGRYNEDDFIDEDPNDYPFKKIDDLKLKDSKNSKHSSSSTNSNGAKLTPYEKKLIDEMDTKSRLTTINEEKSKFKAFGRSNRLVPIDDGKLTKSKGYNY